MDGGANFSELVGRFVFLLFLVALYLVPSTIAIRRQAEHKLPIILINLFLGWTIGAWVGTLVWAINSPLEKEGRACPFCAERVKPKAVACPHCRRDLVRAEPQSAFSR